MYEDMDHHQWQRTMFGHTFSVSRSADGTCSNVSKNVTETFGCWLRAHEEAQAESFWSALRNNRACDQVDRIKNCIVMLASVLVVVGIWWLVKAVLSLVINLICPLMVVLVAVVCVPQLLAPLVGQNYPLLAGLLKKILMKLADTIKVESSASLN